MRLDLPGGSWKAVLLFYSDQRPVRTLPFSSSLGRKLWWQKREPRECCCGRRQERRKLRVHPAPVSWRSVPEGRWASIVLPPSPAEGES